MSKVTGNKESFENVPVSIIKLTLGYSPVDLNENQRIHLNLITYNFISGYTEMIFLVQVMSRELSERI